MAFLPSQTLKLLYQILIIIAQAPHSTILNVLDSAFWFTLLFYNMKPGEGVSGAPSPGKPQRRELHKGNGFLGRFNIPVITSLHPRFCSSAERQVF